MLDDVKKAVYQNLEEIFTLAAVDKITGDTSAYKKKLETIARIADILGVPTKITAVEISLTTFDIDNSIKVHHG